MQSLANVTIDAGVIVVPDSVGSDYGPYEYVENVESCGLLLQERWINVTMSEQARDDLVDHGLYPYWDKLQNLFDSHHIVEYDIHTVAKVVNKLMEVPLSFENHFQIDDVLQENVETTPDISRLNSPDFLRENLEQSITLIAVLRQYCYQPLTGPVLFIRKTSSPKIKVRTDIQMLDHTRDDLPKLKDPLGVFEGEVLVCDDRKKFILGLDESAMLLGARNDKELEIAVKVKLYRHAIELGKPVGWDCVKVPVIGSQFRELCQSLCANQVGLLPAKILRTISDIVYNLKLNKTHALRTGPGANDRQQTRGSDKAWRRNVDQTLRLHYWKGDHGAIELATVNEHDVFDIPR